MNVTEYQYKSTPFAHQREVFERTCDLPHYALFWEQGTAKTKPTLDTATYLFETGKIDGLLVLAPNGVHRNWVTDEIPAHFPDRIKPYCHIYYSAKASTKTAREGVKNLLEAPSLAVLVMTYDGFMTNAGRALATTFLERRRCLYVLDESHRIKTPGAKRTKAILASGKYAPYRRILTGTPIANGPFDAYTQMKFLHLEFWKPYYLDSYTIFKHHFGIWKKLNPDDTTPWAAAYCVAYRNLDQLEQIIAQHSHRVTKEQVLDLPPKLYSKRYFELNAEQKRIYRDIEEEFMTFLGDELVTAPLAITRLLRLQQVVCGYIPCDSGDPVLEIGESNPRLLLLQEVVEDCPHKAIIWARFSRDIDKICALLGDRCVRYDGKVGDDERAANKEAFQNGDKQFIVINNAINEGLTLTAARTVIYYNNTFRLTDRLQSEDRAHRLGQKHPVSYIDLVCQDTIDEYVVENLVKKHDIAGQILGDEFKAWLRKD